MSDEISQRPALGFGIQTTDLPENSDPRCPTVLLLDVSGSMSGTPITELQTAASQYLDELCADPLARRRVEVAIVTFGGSVQVAHPFATADKFKPPTLTASGDTPMAQAIIKGLDLLKERKAELTSMGIPQFRAWVFLITDGGPTDDHLPAWTDAARRIRDGEQRKSFLFFSVGVHGSNFQKLNELGAEKPPIELHGLRFRDLFQWLSASQRAVAASQPNQALQLPPVSWGTITT